MAAGDRRRWVKLGAKVLVALAAIYLMLRWFERAQVYHPSRALDASPEQLARPFEDLRFKASDGVGLHGWFFPAGTHSPRRDWVFLVCHGNGGNISHRLGLARSLLKSGAAVFLLDYRGYGQSEGRPSEEGTYRDAQAAYAWLREKGFAANQILAYGESLGGGVASELAVREPVGALVLHSTFTSIPDIGAELFPWLPVRTISTIRYDTRSKLPKIQVPVLILHSRSDSLIGFQHSQTNFAAAKEPKWFGELHGDHNDPVYEEPGFGEAIDRLLNQVSPADAKPPRP